MVDDYEIEIVGSDIDTQVLQFARAGVFGQRALMRLVDASRRHAWTVVLAGILLAAGSAFYASHHLGVNTDTDQMFSASLPWRQRAMALDRARLAAIWHLGRRTHTDL